MEMKRIMIFCEGDTEVEFCKKTLAPYFLNKNIIIENSSWNGIKNWQRIKLDVENFLKNDTTCFVSTFLDYYGIHTKHDFPNWEQAHTQFVTNKSQRLDFIEQQMKFHIHSSLQNRFLPYLQLHEFEALLFIDKEKFCSVFPDSDFHKNGKQELSNIFNDFPNPEEINNSRNTSPSHRLKEKIICGWHKIVFGNIIAEIMGLEAIRAKCPRFDEWIIKLENL
jgi:Domain of unknown function (DUF4276)